MNNIIFSLYSIFIEVYLVAADDSAQKTIASFKKIFDPVFHTIMGVLYMVFISIVIYKVAILSKDLAQSSDEPEKRAEIKKAFFYTLGSIVVIFLAVGSVHILVSNFLPNFFASS